MLWFWHTRKRSSCARPVTRRSSASSARLNVLKRSTTSATLFRTIQLLDQRLDLLLHHLRRERADLLVADHAVAVDQVGLRHTVDTVVDADASVRVEDDQLVRVAVALQPRQRVVALILVVEPDDRHQAGLRDARDYRMLDEARRTPRRPHVQQPHF